MRIACILFCCLFFIYSCNSNEDKSKRAPATKENAVQSADDIALQGWLKSKIWTAENDMAPMSLLKLRSDDTCELKSGKPSTWEIKNGKLGLSRLTEWPVEKISDSTFRLYVKPTDKWFVYKQTGTIE